MHKKLTKANKAKKFSQEKKKKQQNLLSKLKNISLLIKKMKANKLVSVFLMCMIVLSPVNVSMAGNEDNCYKNCHADCTSTTNYGNTYCSLRCEADCGYKELKGTFHFLRP